MRPAREIIVIHVDDPDPILPELDCPVGTDERRSGLTQWCSTPRGVKHGPYTRWHDNGQIAVEGEYAYGERDGMWIRWYDDGATQEEGEYLDGDKIGTWIRWDRDGDELGVHEYD